GSRTVTVTTPGISGPAPVAVGAGLQLSTSATLGAPQHGGVNVTVASSAPSVVRVSPNDTTAGAGSIDLPIANGTVNFGFVIQGVEGASGTAVLTISAPGFTSTTVTVTVEPAALEIQGLNLSTTAAAADDTTWYVAVGLANPTNTALRSFQNVRAG